MGDAAVGSGLPAVAGKPHRDALLALASRRPHMHLNTFAPDCVLSTSGQIDVSGRSPCCIAKRLAVARLVAPIFV